MSRRIHLISDLHLGHEGILHKRAPDGELIRPGFDSVDQMNDRILTSWNETVANGDRVYLLGDVTMGRREDFTRLWPKFNGSKQLILGNHDDVKFLSSGGFFKNIFAERKLADRGLLLTHRPVHEDGLGLHEGGQNLLNVHGHIHHKYSPAGPYLNVAAELLDYRPIDIEEAIEFRRKFFDIDRGLVL